MARIRSIKPEFWTDEDIALLDSDTKLLAIGLLNHSDDEGYFKAHEALIKAAVFPFSDNSLNIHGMLKRLKNARYLTLFTGTDGKQYGHIRNFLIHQKVNRPNPSKIKALKPVTDNSVSYHEQLTYGKEQGTGNREHDTAVGGGENFQNFPCEKITNVCGNSLDDHPVWKWEPSEIVFQELKRHKIPEAFIREQISQFKTYRAGLQDGYQNLDAKFISSVLGSWKRIGHNWKESPEHRESEDPFAGWEDLGTDDDEEQDS